MSGATGRACRTLKFPFFSGRMKGSYLKRTSETLHTPPLRTDSHLRVSSFRVRFAHGRGSSTHLEARFKAQTRCATHVGGLSDEPLLGVKDVPDASDQLQGTAVIRALEEKQHMCSVSAR